MDCYNLPLILEVKQKYLHYSLRWDAAIGVSVYEESARLNKIKNYPPFYLLKIKKSAVWQSYH